MGAKIESHHTEILFDVYAYSLVGHQTLHNVSPYKKEKKRKTTRT